MFSDTKSAILTTSSIVISLIISINMTQMITAWVNGAVAAAAKFLMAAFFIFPITLVIVFCVVLLTVAFIMTAMETAYTKIRGGNR